MGSTQVEIKNEVTRIKQTVIDALGEKRKTKEVRDNQAYQNYVATCGECQDAFEDGELTPRMVQTLQTLATRVIELFKQ